MSPPDLLLESRSQFIKNLAVKLGFQDCRIAKAEALKAEAEFLKSWINKGMHGEMSYMANHFDKRTDPTILMEGARSVIVLTKNYFPSSNLKLGPFRISKYAYGKDYHDVIRPRLNDMLIEIEKTFGPIKGRGFVDSAPVLEKAWAQKAGIGWMGKHTNIISKKVGSFFFLAVLIIDVDLAVDQSVADHCGNCTACIDACPTNAIEEPYVLNASKCISYLTIELKTDSIPKEFKGTYNSWIFGCDICQDVCPWNRFSTAHDENEFEVTLGIKSIPEIEMENITIQQFDEMFLKSPIKRTGFKGLLRNIRFLVSDS